MYENLPSQQPPRGYGILALAIVLGLTVMGVLILVGLSLGQRDTSREQKAADRREVVAEAFSYACTEIEKLKAGERDAAWKSYRDLAKTLKLLKLARTPEIEKAAVEARDSKLRRYRAAPCPIQGQLR